MFYKRLKQENKELKDMFELLKKQNDEKSEWIKHLIKKSERQDVCSKDTDWGKIKANVLEDYSNYVEKLKETPVSDLQCSARLRNILKGLVYNNEDQSFKSMIEIHTRKEIQERRGMGVKLFDELDSMRLEAGIQYKR